jgi:hypothetical protein
MPMACISSRVRKITRAGSTRIAEAASAVRSEPKRSGSGWLCWWGRSPQRLAARPDAIRPDPPASELVAAGFAHQPYSRSCSDGDRPCCQS